MTHKSEKASAETLDNMKTKETVQLAQLLTYVFDSRKISGFTVHVLYCSKVVYQPVRVGFSFGQSLDSTLYFDTCGPSVIQAVSV